MMKKTERKLMKIYGTRTGIDFARYATFLPIFFSFSVSETSFDRKIIYLRVNVDSNATRFLRR